jgi:dipeptidyl aminopeptidase/acylaminoacyl peptidase
LVDPRSREWELVDTERGDRAVIPGISAVPQTITARDGLNLNAWLYRPIKAGASAGAVMFLHGGPEDQARPGYNDIFSRLVDDGFTVLMPNVRGSGGFGRTFVHADDKENRFAAIDDVADCARFLVDNGLADPHRIACAGWSYGGYLTLAALTFHPDLFAAGISICGMSDLSTFYRNTEPWIADSAYPEYGHPIGDRELLEQLSPLRRADALVAPLLVVHGAHDTNVPVSESEQIVDALRQIGRNVRYLLFGNDGHGIIKRENRATLAAAMSEWIIRAFDATEGLGLDRAASSSG